MIKTFQLAGYEVRRFKGPLPILGLLFLVLLPLLFGALYLWSSWDPFGKTDQIPVAVVNEDVPVQTPSGSLIDAGTRVVAQMQDDEIYDWQFVDADTAAAGLANGGYYLTITIPPDFSANLASGGTDDPQRAVVNVRRDDANGYFISILTASVQDKLATAIDAAAIGAYFDSVFTNLETIQSEAQLAADAAAQLATTATDAATQATDTEHRRDHRQGPIGAAARRHHPRAAEFRRARRRSDGGAGRIGRARQRPLRRGNERRQHRTRRGERGAKHPGPVEHRWPGARRDRWSPAVDFDGCLGRDCRDRGGAVEHHHLASSTR